MVRLPSGKRTPQLLYDTDLRMPALAEVPRVPVSDDSMTSEGPTYRDLWLRIRDELPKKGRKTDQLEGPPKLPKELQGAIHSLHSNYARQFEAWDKDKEEFFGATPPIFIVVCGRSGAGLRALGNACDGSPSWSGLERWARKWGESSRSFETSAGSRRKAADAGGLIALSA